LGTSAVRGLAIAEVEYLLARLARRDDRATFG
jgi:hypothetical protein